MVVFVPSLNNGQDLIRNGAVDNSGVMEVLIESYPHEHVTARVILGLVAIASICSLFSARN